MAGAPPGCGQDERPALFQRRRDQPARLGPRRDSRAPLALEERPGLVLAADLAWQVDRVQMPDSVRLQGKQRERGREPVRDTRLDDHVRPLRAQQRVEVGPLRVADRAERVPRCRDGLVMLAALREQVLLQPAVRAPLPRRRRARPGRPGSPRTRRGCGAAPGPGPDGARREQRGTGVVSTRRTRPRIVSLGSWTPASFISP